MRNWLIRWAIRRITKEQRSAGKLLIHGYSRLGLTRDQAFDAYLRIVRQGTSLKAVLYSKLYS